MALLGVSQAGAATYTYSGNDFTYFTPPYTNTEYISGTFTLTPALGPSQNVSVAPSSFSFSDGVETITKATAGLANFEFITDPTGLIIDWQIIIQNSAGTKEIETLGGPFFLSLGDFVINLTYPPTGGIQFTTVASAGPTALSPKLATTPLPSTWTMLIAGFIGLGFFAYRGKKKNSAALAAA